MITNPSQLGTYHALRANHAPTGQARLFRIDSYGSVCGTASAGSWREARAQMVLSLCWSMRPCARMPPRVCGVLGLREKLRWSTDLSGWHAPCTQFLKQLEDGTRRVPVGLPGMARNRS